MLQQVDQWIASQVGTIVGAGTVLFVFGLLVIWWWAREG